MTIIANWKSHKNFDQVREFFDKFAPFMFEQKPEHEVIIAPSSPFLKYSSDFVHANDLKVEIAAQNISQNTEGAFTGEVAASQLKNISKFVIIGHSERRRFYGETEEVVDKKVQLAKKEELKVILCLQNENEKTADVEYIAYEPPNSIGTGNPDDPTHIEEVFKKIKEKNNKAKLLYGGSINEKNISTFTKIPHLEGFLVGGASLEADSFTSLIAKC